MQRPRALYDDICLVDVARPRGHRPQLGRVVPAGLLHGRVVPERLCISRDVQKSIDYRVLLDVFVEVVVGGEVEEVLPDLGAAAVRAGPPNGNGSPSLIHDYDTNIQNTMRSCGTSSCSSARRCHTRLPGTC